MLDDLSMFWNSVLLVGILEFLQLRFNCSEIMHLKRSVVDTARANTGSMSALNGGSLLVLDKVQLNVAQPQPSTWTWKGRTIDRFATHEVAIELAGLSLVSDNERNV